MTWCSDELFTPRLVLTPSCLLLILIAAILNRLTQDLDLLLDFHPQDQIIQAVIITASLTTLLD